MATRLNWLGIVLLLVGGILSTATSAVLSGMILGGCGLLLLIAAIFRILQRSRVDDLRFRAPLYTMNTILLALLVAGIFLAVNVLIHRRPWRMDLTGNRRHTLAPQTVNLLKSIQLPVKVTVFVAETDGMRQKAADLLDLYVYHKADLTVELVDLNKRPDLASQLKVSAYRTIVVETGGRQERFSGELDEERMTRALLIASRQRPRTAAFLTGHGERSLDDDSDGGCSRLKTLLEDSGYAVRTLSAGDAIPEDIDLLAVIGPRLDPLQTTEARIVAALNRGVSLLLCLDPSPGKNWAGLTTPLGVDVTDTLIFDRQGSDMADNPMIPVIIPAGTHPVTRDLNSMCAFPLARCVRVGKQPSDVWQVQVLLRTRRESFAKRDFQQENQEFDPEKDIPGPVALSVALEHTAPSSGEVRLQGPGKIVVAGDSDFLSNHSLYFQGNYLLARNLALWLTEDESLIALDAKPWLANTIRLSHSQRWAVFWVVIVLLPGIFLLSGTFVYLRSRG